MRRDAGYRMPDAGYANKDAMNDAMLEIGDGSSTEYPEGSSCREDDGGVLHDAARPMSYRDLKVWHLAKELSVEIHRLTLERLPRFELHEEGAQIRRSSKSIRSNVVEGFGRRRDKQDFIKHLVYAEASCDETIDHLDTVFETGSLNDRAVYESLRPRLCELGRRLNRFIAAVEEQHESPK
jgi:four helix bundle protein